MMGNFYANSAIGPWLSWLYMLLWWAIFIVGLAVLIRWLVTEAGKPSRSAKSALDVLKERYAKGEIDKKEFEEKKKDIS